MIRCALINGFDRGGHLINYNLLKNRFFSTDNEEWGNFRVISKEKESNLNG